MNSIRGFILIFCVFLLSCGGGSVEKGNVVVLGGTSIPVLKTEKARKSKLAFDLVEVIRKKDKLDMVMMISNKGEEVGISFFKEELSLTDNEGFIQKSKKANINGVEQFKSDEKATISKDGKIKSVISFSGIREEATTSEVFLKGISLREGKEREFKIKFKNIPLQEK